MFFNGRKKKQDSASLREVFGGADAELLNPFKCFETEGSNSGKLLLFLLLILLGFTYGPRAHGSAARQSARLRWSPKKIESDCMENYVRQTTGLMRPPAGICVRIFSPLL